MAPRYGPPDPSLAPRYTGVRTFARFPHVTAPDGVDAAIVGVPFDTATSYRPGARFGPEAIRAGSLLLRPWHPPLEVDVFASQSLVDWGDLAVTPGNAERTAAQIHDGLRPLVAAGITPLVFGGDHSIVLGELRAHAERHGPLGLVLIDAHADTWDEYYGERYFHGTPFRRAFEEGLLAPERSTLAGMRGPLYGPADLAEPRGWGFEILSCDALRALDPGRLRAARARARRATGRCSCRSTSTRSTRRSRPRRARRRSPACCRTRRSRFLRSLAGLTFTGFDLVEVAPAYDGPGQTTAVLAAAIAYELLALRAVAAG